MRPRLAPYVAACWILALGSIFSGCASSAAGGAPPLPSGGYARILVETTSRTKSAEIFVNGQSQGFSPLQLRLDVDEFGHVLEDIEVTAQWDDGGAETTRRIFRGSRPEPIISLNVPGSGF